CGVSEARSRHVPFAFRLCLKRAVVRDDTLVEKVALADLPPLSLVQYPVRFQNLVEEGDFDDLIRGRQLFVIHPSRFRFAFHTVLAAHGAQFYTRSWLKIPSWRA